MLRPNGRAAGANPDCRTGLEPLLGARTDEFVKRNPGADAVAENDVFVRFESKVQSYARAFPAIFARACGTELWDVQGRRYLDFLADAGSVNYGHNNPVL